jgi:DNA-binding NarL/FixJ family response regulator
VRCLTRVQQDELWFEKALTDSLMSSGRILVTPRENRLVVLLTQGLKNKEIAATMGIEEGSVKVHLSRLYRNPGVRD